MSKIINKLLGRDDESEILSHSCKADVKCDSETCSASTTGGEKCGGKHDSTIVNSAINNQETEGRTVKHGDVNVKSTVSSDFSSTVSTVNQQKLNDLVSKLGSTHSQIDEYAKQQTEKINETVQLEIDHIVACTRNEQEGLIRQANECTTQIDVECRGRLQKMVEEIDADRAKRIAEIENELHKRQVDIIKTAKHDIDQLNKKAASLKIDILKEAQSKAASDAKDITAQASRLGQTSTIHESTGSTTIKTSVSAVTTDKEIGGTTKTATQGTYESASGARREVEESTEVETNKHQS